MGNRKEEASHFVSTHFYTYMVHSNALNKQIALHCGTVQVYPHYAGGEKRKVCDTDIVQFHFKVMVIDGVTYIHIHIHCRLSHIVICEIACSSDILKPFWLM